MSKKIIIAIVAVLMILAAGGVFWRWNSQADVRELNKNLPQGIRVEKTLSGKYRVVNKIDGYEFWVPGEWEGVGKIRLEKNIVGTELSIENNIEDINGVIILESHLLAEGLSPLDSIEIRFLKFNDKVALDLFVDQFKTAFIPYRKTERLEFIPIVEEFMVEGFMGLKLYTTVHYLPDGESDIIDTYYFLSVDSKIYIFIHFNDDLVREIIANGKW